MPSAGAVVRRRVPDGDSATRTTLLDAAEALLLEEGYAAVTSRRLAAKAGTNPALLYYYFANMDDLFVALFRRGSERSFGRLKQALDSPQPLWAMWGLIHDYSSTALTMEFMALANHRKVIRAEIAAASKRFRQLQLKSLTRVLEGYGVDAGEWPPVSIIILMSGVSRFMLIEEELGVRTGHTETIALVERHIEALEGPRC